MVLTEITYFHIFGFPLIAYLGLFSLVVLLVTAAIPVMNRKGIRKIPIKWHFRLAYLLIALAVLHGLLGMAAYI